MIDTIRFIVMHIIRKGVLGILMAQDTVCIGGQKFLPFLVRLDNFHDGTDCDLGRHCNPPLFPRENCGLVVPSQRSLHSCLG